jgi:hypothetical protein
VSDLKLFTGREDIPKKLHLVCEECLKLCREKYSGVTDENGVYHQDGFACGCSYIPISEEYYPASLKAQMSPEEWTLANSLKSPLLWGETNLIDPDTGRPWKAWPYQRGFLLCTCSRISARWGRRTGKTTALAVLILWFLFTSGGGAFRDPETKKIRRNLKVLLLAPQKAHIANIFERMRAFLSANPELSRSVTRDKRGSPEIIAVSDPSGFTKNEVSGFTSGDAAGSKGLGPRGQDADLVVMDEGAFVSEFVILNTVHPILYTKPTTRYVVTSTPGISPGDYFEKICTKRPDFKEFYVPATFRPDWEEVKEQVVRDFGNSQEEWDKEVMALFSAAGIGVYRPDIIKQAQIDRPYGSFRYTPGLIYTLGADWNKEHGTEIAVIGTSRGTPYVSFLVWAENIPKKEFSTLSGVERIIELNKIWKLDWAYVDAGGGDGGALLRNYGLTQVGKDIFSAKLKDIVRTIDFGSKLEVQESSGIKNKYQAKHFMVNNSVRKLESGTFKYPREDTLLTAQLGNYVVKSRTISDIPVYGLNEKRWGDHRLDAVNLALLAVRLEYPSFSGEQVNFTFGEIGFIPPSDKNSDRIIVPSFVAASTEGRNIPYRRDKARIPFDSGRGIRRVWGTIPSEENRFPNRRRFK